MESRDSEIGPKTELPTPNRPAVVEMQFHNASSSCRRAASSSSAPAAPASRPGCRNALPEALHLDLLLPDRYRELRSRPERLRELVAGEPPERPVVIDEMQRIPELAHAWSTPSSNGTAGASSSSPDRAPASCAAAASTCSPGRAVRGTLHPFMAAELPDFDLEQALTFGLLPLVVAAAEPREVLDAYVHALPRPGDPARGLGARTSATSPAFSRR